MQNRHSHVPNSMLAPDGSGMSMAISMARQPMHPMGYGMTGISRTAMTWTVESSAVTA